MEAVYTAAFFILALLSDVAGTVAGFGSSTIFLPFALFFVDFPTALVLVGFSHLFGNLGRVSFFRRGLDRRLLLTFGASSVAFSFLGAWLVPLVPQPLLKGILGIFLLVFSALSFGGGQLRLPAEPATAYLGGTLSGFFAGLIGTGGALRGAFLTAYGLPKEAYIATAAAIAIATDVVRVPTYLLTDGLARRYWAYVPVLLVTALVGTWIGKRLVDKLPQRTFRRIVLLCIAAVAAKFIWEAAR
jgi:hypothetical protein